MLAWLPGESLRTAQLEERVDWELRGHVARQLVSDRVLPVLAHLALAGVMVLLLWDVLPARALGAWMAAVTVAAGYRWRQLALSARHSSPAQEVVRVLRGAVAIQGLAWGLGVLAVASDLTLTSLAFVMVVFAGMIAASPMTLIGDPRSFYLFVGTLVSPLLLAVVRVADSREHIAALVLIALYVALMAAYFRRSHRAYIESARTAKRLEFSQEEAARERGFLDALITSAPTAIAAVSRNGRVLGVNPGFEKTFGYAAADIVGRRLDDFLVPPDERDPTGLIEGVGAGEAVVSEGRRLTADGESLFVRIAAAPVEGIQQGGVFVLYDDITAMKTAELALREAEAQYRQLVESASDLVWRVDRAGRWTFLNAAVETIYGAQAEDLLGRDFRERVHPHSLPETDARFREVFDGGEVTDFEAVHRDVHGTLVTLSFSARPVRDAQGEIIGAHGTARDVTARVEIREALERARDSAQHSAGVRTAFLANMSHEIRTPLNGVLGMTELLLDSELNDEQRRLADMAHTSGVALLELINDVLDFSKVEAGRIELEAIPFELPGLAVNAARVLAVRAGERHVELATDIAQDVPERVRGDAGRLRQVLTNLISNAVKFTENGDVVLSIQVLQELEQAVRLRFSVQDTGIGIPADKLGAIFEEFQQADLSTTREYGGTGLGLAISQRLVAVMGGDLRVRSEVGRGSEFWFDLSLPVEATEDQPVGPPLPELSGRHALVVDDNAVTVRTFGDMFSSAGVAVVAVGGTTQALETLRERTAEAPIDFVVLDAQLPGKDGFELAQEIRSDEVLAGTGLMICTSSGQRGDGRRCRELGIDAYLVKPVERSELLEAAARVLDYREHPDRRGDLITRHSIRESRRRVTILLAEDNPVNQEVAALLLRKRGHEVTIADNGRAAVDAVREGGRFDVILMDIQMPELDGVAATAEIRALPGGDRIPVVALTAHATAGDRERYLAQGMDDYLTKPFRPNDLFAAVERTGQAAARPDGATPGEGLGAGTPVDVTAFREEMRAAGVESAVDQMLGVFIGDAPGRLRTLKKVAKLDDPEAIRTAAHAYKSACRTIRAYRLSELLQEAESAAAAGNVARARAVVPAITKAHKRVMTYLQGLPGGAEVAA